MKKLSFLTIISGAIFLLAACGGPAPTEDAMPTDANASDAMMGDEAMEPLGAATTDSGVTVASEPTTVPDPAPDPAPSDPAPQVKNFTMTAKQWEFSPSTITVNEGDTVHLSITSVDVTHGFALPQFGVSAQLQPNKTVEVEFVADKAGTYTFFCNVFCGSGHGGMKGTLVVQ